MEVATGKIRAMANLTRTQEGTDDTPSVYEESFNHAIGTAAGSRIHLQIGVLITAMESGGVKPDDEIDTGNGVVSFYGRRMSDSNADKGGHGTLTTEEIFEVSSNVGTALTLKGAFGEEPQAFLDGLQRLGVHEPTGIRLAGESRPEVTTPEVEAAVGLGFVTQMSIGYEVTQTPLQIWNLYNAIANGGTLMRPPLIERLGIKRDGRPHHHTRSGEAARICSAATLEACQRMMRRVADPDWPGNGPFIFCQEPVHRRWQDERSAHRRTERLRRALPRFVRWLLPRRSSAPAHHVVIADTRSGVYYGSSIAGPVFRELANKVYATDRVPRKQPRPADRGAPLAGGERRSPRRIDQPLHRFRPALHGRQHQRLGDGSGSRRQHRPHPRAIQPSHVPDVRGMGLRDAFTYSKTLDCGYRPKDRAPFTPASLAPGSAINYTSSITIELADMKLLKEILYGTRIQNIMGFNTRVAIEDLAFDRKVASVCLSPFLAWALTDMTSSNKRPLSATAIVCERLPEQLAEHITYVRVMDARIALGSSSKFYDDWCLDGGRDHREPTGKRQRSACSTAVPVPWTAEPGCFRRLKTAYSTKL